MFKRIYTGLQLGNLLIHIKEHPTNVITGKIESENFWLECEVFTLSIGDEQFCLTFRWWYNFTYSNKWWKGEFGKVLTKRFKKETCMMKSYFWNLWRFGNSDFSHRRKAICFFCALDFSHHGFRKFIECMILPKLNDLIW